MFFTKNEIINEIANYRISDEAISLLQYISEKIQKKRIRINEITKHTRFKR